MKPNLSKVTLLAADTTQKSHLARRAIEKSCEQCTFGAVKLLTNNPFLDGGISIPQIEGLDGYSNFCIRNMGSFVDTSHALVIQSDGYVLNGPAWSDEFLEYDYIGAPWLPANAVGNGGFSLRSKRLMDILARRDFGDSPHPEDNYICIRHRFALEQLGMKFAPIHVARKFAFEGRSWNDGVEWTGVPTAWNGQFGFHSWLTPIPREIEKPKIFHHTGDYGDVIYSLPVMKKLGGGILFLSADNRYPFPRPSREQPTPAWVNNLAPLLEAQDYVWRAQYTHGLPYSTDYDLNRFREPWQRNTAANWHSIFKLHLDAFRVSYPEDEPWLSVDDPITVPGRPIVVSRSPRYHNDGFPWYDLVQKYADQMVFVGLESEGNVFQGFGAPGYTIRSYPTKDFLELARVIAGGKVFIGNQSAPLAVALGLGQKVIVETWPQNANCKLKRANAIHWERGPVEIPPSWLS